MSEPDVWSPAQAFLEHPVERRRALQLAAIEGLVDKTGAIITVDDVIARDIRVKLS